MQIKFTTFPEKKFAEICILNMAIFKMLLQAKLCTNIQAEKVKLSIQEEISDFPLLCKIRISIIFSIIIQIHSFIPFFYSVFGGQKKRKLKLLMDAFVVKNLFLKIQY